MGWASMRAAAILRYLRRVPSSMPVRWSMWWATCWPRVRVRSLATGSGESSSAIARSGPRSSTAALNSSAAARVSNVLGTFLPWWRNLTRWETDWSELVRVSMLATAHPRSLTVP